MGLRDFYEKYDAFSFDVPPLVERLRYKLETVARDVALGAEHPVVEIRVKSRDSILAKLTNDAAGRSPAQVLGSVDDLVGARLVVLSKRQAQQVKSKVSKLDVFRQASVRTEHKGAEDGYQAIHVNGLSSQQISGVDVGIEIQIRLAFHDAWARLAHAYTYKKERATRDLPDYLSAIAKAMDGIAKATELAAQRLADDRAVLADLKLLLLPEYMKQEEEYVPLSLDNGVQSLGLAEWKSTADITSPNGQKTFSKFPSGTDLTPLTGIDFRFSLDRPWLKYLILDPTEQNTPVSIKIDGTWNNIRSVYIVAMAGNGWEQDPEDRNFSFKDQQIGSVRLCDDSEEWTCYPLLLNHNVREWTAPRRYQRVCDEISKASSTLSEVWSDPDHMAVLDCLRLATFPIARNLRSIRIEAKFGGDLKAPTRPGLPTLNLFAMTLGRARTSGLTGQAERRADHAVA